MQENRKPNRRPASSVTARAWALVLTLCLLMTGSLGARAQTFLREPFLIPYASKTATASVTPSLQHNVYQLRWNYFNWKETKDNGYVGDVWLTIDGEKVIKLNEVFPTTNGEGITDIRGHEGKNQTNAKERVFGEGTFKWGDNKSNDGWVMLSERVGWESNKDLTIADYSQMSWMKVTIMLSTRYSGKSHKIGITGTWVDYKDTKGTKTLEVTTVAPDIEFPASVKVARVGNATAKVGGTDANTAIELKQDMVTDDTGATVKYRYAFDFYKDDHRGTTGTNYPTWDETVSYEQYGKSNPSPMGSSYYSNTNVEGAHHSYTSDGASGASIYLGVDNYKPQTIYPSILRYQTSPGYTFKDGPNTQTDTKGTGTTHTMRVMAVKYYPAITLSGYPRPNPVASGNNASTAAGAMHVTFDPWSKNATLTWTPEIYDKNNVNTNGKWVIFRKVTGTNDNTAIKLGSVDYNTKTFVDNTDKVYGTQYTYIVAFSPTDWNGEIQKFSDATGLWTNIRETLKRSETFFTGVTASTDQTNKIKVSWTHASIKDASSTKPYTIKIYRGRVTTKNGSTSVSWGTNTCKEISVTSSATTSGSWEDVATSTLLKNHREIYQYRLEIEAQETTYKATSNNGHIYGEAAEITSVTSSRGNFQGSVIINWEVKRSGTAEILYTVKRRPLGSKNDADYQLIYSTASTASSFSYEDKNAQPGCFYEYKVEAIERDMDGSEYPTYTTTDGFALASGIVNGRVYYDTGTAVEGVKVMLERSGNDEAASTFRSMTFSGDDGMYFNPGDPLNDVVHNDFSVQLWVKPIAGRNGTQQLFWTQALRIELFKEQKDKEYNVRLSKNNGDNEFIGTNLFTIAPDEWTHLTFTYNHTNGQCIVYKSQGPSTELVSKIDPDNRELTAGSGTLRFGRWFAGELDEARIFTKVLSKDEILKNMDHRLSGSEPNLYAYYPMDEGIEGVTTVYDYSKSGGLANGHHATINSTHPNIDVPNSAQFSLCAYTDVNGNYSITGVPFSGDGTAYSVAPVYGTHEFSPAKVNRYISTSSLIADAVDFKDVSSFSVKGTVYYEGTTVPVDSVRFAVDGVTCTRNNEIVLSDTNGEFEISVPIGYHYITASRNGHTFVAEGRYPANPDPNSNETREFTKDLTGMKFYDNTLVPVVGRVTGGPTEYTYPLGFGESSNNIGQVQLTLKAGDTYRLNVQKVDDEAASTFVTATTDRQFAAPKQYTDNYAFRGLDVKSKAWAGSRGSTDTEQQGDDKARTITVLTDPVTGEFAAMLPPLNYTVQSMRIVGDTESEVSLMPSDGSKPMIDATNVLRVNTDSVSYEATLGTVKRTFDYVASLNRPYRSAPVLEVTQPSAKGQGALGEYETRLKKSNGEYVTVNFYDKDASDLGNLSTAIVPGTTAYTYNYPVFLQGKVYDFDLNLYETYHNYDTGKTIDVPLPNVVVTVGNEMGNGNTVAIETAAGETMTDYKGRTMVDGSIVELKENEVMTDEQGHATYSWTCGWPNIQDDFTRTLTMTYDADGPQSWRYNGMKGIILGGLQTGNNFVTAAPDEVSMILRDPAGSNSYAYIEEGYSTTHTKTNHGSVYKDDETMMETHFGLDLQKIVGLWTPGGTITAVSEEASSSSTVTSGLQISNSIDDNETTSTTVTATKRVQTSDDPMYVGAMGDVFIGNSMNYIFGNVREVGLHFNDDETQLELNMKNVLQMGKEFATEFNYTQYHIENRLIPQFIEQRNSHLIHVDSYSALPVNNTDQPKYYTTLSPDDPRYGTDNCDKAIWGSQAAKAGALEGPSYKIVLPVDFHAGGRLASEAYNDTIAFYNAQISGWQQTLANNERSKVTALENRKDYLVTNFSFDGGASVENSVTTTDFHEHEQSWTFNTRVILGFGTDFNLAGNGCDISATTSAGVSGGKGNIDSTENNRTVGYVIADSSDDDVLSISVFDDPEGYGPIFYTEAGQTSCPYEDVVTTKYYQAGYVISQKTMQIEQPHISAEVTEVTGVPVGKPATFTVMLQNTSEIGEDCYFNLNVMDGTNPHGAGVFIDDVSLNYGRTILVPAGKTLYKTVQIKPTREDIVDYENIGLRISSVCQPDDTGTFPEISDTLFLSAHFQQASSDIELAAAETALNISTGSVLHTTISGYDANSRGFKGVRLQAQLAGSPDWLLVKEWLKDADEAAALGKEVLTDKGTFQYNLNMDDAQTYPDGLWNIRAITFSKFGAEELITPSALLTLSKDMARPQLITAATPTNGILTADSEISLTFNEDIRSGAISKADNFIVRGELNDARVQHNVAMNLTGADGAKTAASVNLAERSFAVNMWLKYAAAGHVFTHGSADENMDLSLNAEGRLVATVGGQSFTSTEALPRDKWFFLSFAYDADAESIYADYAEGATSKNLFMNKSVGKYLGNGAITFGQGLTGQMHEVTLWSDARSFTEAQRDMYTRKTRYTDGLMGYWRMDEGHGALATDYSRSRDLTLPGQNAWYLAGDNYAMTLDGAHGAAFNTGDVVTDADESYTIELWFQADAAQKADANIVGFNTADQLDLYLDAAGRLKMDALGTTYDVSNANYRDGQWHHLALNVLKSSNGNATVYVDGAALKSVSAASLPVIATSKMLVGCHKTAADYDRPLKGAIDEIRVWTGRRTADVIKGNMFARVDEKAEGLMAYYPFERIQLDEADVAETVVTLDDQARGAQPMAHILGGDAIATSKTSAPALKTAPTLQNVAFNFVASERKLLITLDENPERLENCVVHLTAKSIRDTHNNESEPISWDVLIRQNQLLWAQNQMDVRKEGAEPASFSVGIRNNGATPQNWTISGLPTWLTATTESGSLNGASDRNVQFTIAPSLAIGKYETTVYLTGDLGIAEPLVLNVTSAGEAPLWVATPGESTMVVTSQVVVDGKLSTDTEDMIAAFRGQECVGVAHPRYFPARDAYYALVNIYGASDDGSDLTYKVYDASTGTIYPAVEASDSNVLTFEADKVVGSFVKPVVFTTKNEIEQDLAMNAAGWRWMSFYVDPADKTIADIYTHADGAVTAIVANNASAQYADMWWGNLTTFDVKQMYKVNANAAFGESLVGAPAQTASTIITLNGNGWTWMGYPATASNSLDAALAGANPLEGDIVKSQSRYAMYNGTNWEGTLEVLTPGEGYMYQSTAAGSKTFSFATPAPARARAFRTRYNAPVLALDNRDNMTMLAEVMMGDAVVENAEVTAYTDGQLSGYSAEAIDGKHYLTIGGDTDGSRVTFIIRIGDDVYRLSETLSFEADAQHGTHSAPYVLQIAAPTGVERLDAESAASLYDLAGRRIQKPTMPQGVYIQNGVKVLK